MHERAVKRMGRNALMDEWCTDEGIQLIVNWSRRGLTIAEIAEKMGICLDSLDKWRKKRKAIADAIDGRELAIVQVENALFRECLGYKYKEQVLTKKGEIVEIEKYKLPSLPAQIFFLKNRLPQYWRDRREIEYNDESMQKIIVKWGQKRDDGNTPLPAAPSTEKLTSEQS